MRRVHDSNYEVIQVMDVTQMNEVIRYMYNIKMHYEIGEAL